MDGVCYDKITCQGILNSSTYTSGVNNMSDAYEYYTSSTTYMTLYPQLPATFSVIGSHTFQVKSTQLWNNTLSVMNFSCIINSIPCTKLSGRFWFDCNSNCTFDGTDYYGVGWGATGKLYNTITGYNLLFHPNYSDGKFSVYAPSAGTYSLTQYPTLGTYFNYTACTTGTTTILPNTTNNSLSYGYKNPNVATDPATGMWRISSTSPSLSPLVGATMAIYLWNTAYYACSTVTSNPGQLKVIIPNSINFLNMVTGPSPTVLTGTSSKTLVFNVANFNQNNLLINPFATYSIQVTNTAVPGSTVNIQTIITPTADNYTLNNICNWVRNIGGPFDPNGKYLDSPGLMDNDEVKHGTTQFFYTIGFQNVGNAPAINVRTLDTIDVNFDLNTLDVMQSSYPVNVQMDMNTREVQFHFDGINLPAASANEPGSHGFVRYAIKLKAGVPANTILKNRAHNYFDFNEPVATNQTAHKLVIVPVGLNELNRDASLKAVPNPFNTALMLTSEHKITQVEISDITGKVLKVYLANDNEVTVDVPELRSGIYLVKVTSDNGMLNTLKVIKD
jgi:hypothetical protein